MNNKVFKLISSYKSYLIASYQMIAKVNAAMPVLRLIAEDRDKKTGEIRFKIQIAGKNIFPVISLEDLKNSSTISNFSKKDQEIIRCYLAEEGRGVHGSIIARTYNREIKKFFYTIEYFDTESKIKRCRIVDDLTLLSNDIQNFDAKDRMLIKSEIN